jgi:hypothetical protein
MNKQMVDAICERRGAWLGEQGLSSHRDVRGVHQTLGTDCSGLDTCVFSFRKMKINHTHMFLCVTYARL